MKFIKLMLAVIVLLFNLWLIGLVLFSVGLSHDYQIKTAHDGIVIFTGGKNRIETGLSLYNQNLAGKMLITGVNPDASDEEILPKDAMQMNYNDPDITTERLARTTVENAIETEKWATENNIKTIILVTSDFHMPRAYLEMHTRMPDLEITKHSVRAENSRRKLVLMADEYNKFLFRKTLITLGMK